jgi:hypothetical protein
MSSFGPDLTLANDLALRLHRFLGDDPTSVKWEVPSVFSRCMSAKLRKNIPMGPFPEILKPSCGTDGNFELR